MLTVTTDPTKGVVEIEIDGAVTRTEYDRVVEEMEGAIAHFGNLRIVEIVKDIGSIESNIWWRDIKWGVSHVKHIARCAMVSDKGWVGSITRAVGAVVSAEARVFALDEIDEARRWVREG